MKNQKECVIITAADKNYIKQAKQLFSSVYHNSGWPGDYMLLAYDIPEKDLKWFRDKGIIVRKFRENNLSSKGASKHSIHWNSVTLIKFQVFSPQLKKWRNVLYLDSDIIVRSSLKSLESVKGFWAVKDHLETLEKQFYLKLKEKNSTDLSRKYHLRKPAFNSGVMAFSTDIIKKDTLKDLLAIQEKYHQYNLWGDQGILNLYFYDCWKKLPRKYNFYAPDYKQGYEAAAVIFHNIGPKKIPKDKPEIYKEWLGNLNKSNEINLQSRLKEKKQKNKIKGSAYLTIISTKKKINKAKSNIDYKIGKTGIAIKKVSPKTYIFLKKLLFKKIKS